MKKSLKIAIVRGAYLNQYEMQYYIPLLKRHKLVGFSTLTPIHDQFPFPVRKLASPRDLVTFFGKLGFSQRISLGLLNRVFVDTELLLGLEEELNGFDIAHCAETYHRYTWQCLEAKRKDMIKKVVCTVSENIPFNNEGIRGRKQLKKRAIAEVDLFFAISNQAKEALILEGCNPNKIIVMTHAIDTSAFRPRPRLRQGYSGQAKLNKKLTILFVGRLEKEKGIYEFIFAAKKLLEDKKLENYDLKFQMVGEGTEKRRLQNEERKIWVAGRIEHVCYSYEKMPEAYQRADIFVAPSKTTKYWREQFSTVLLEAQASGLPIVATASGAIRENVGEAAILVEPADFLSLAESIKKLILDSRLRRELGKKARERAVQLFDAQKQAEKIEEAYLGLFK